MISRCPSFRARKVTLGGRAPPEGALHPQGESRSRKERRERNLPRISRNAAAPTISKEMDCWKSTQEKIRRIKPNATEMCSCGAGLAPGGNADGSAGSTPPPRILLSRSARSDYDPLVTGISFHHRHRVTYSECTLGNHVYYARYLDILEEARGEFMRAAGSTFLELQARELAFPVLECHLTYRHAARYDDVLDIEVWLSRLERVRVEFAYRITLETGSLILEGRTLHVSATLTEKPRRMPEDLAGRLLAYLAPAPPGPLPSRNHDVGA